MARRIAGVTYIKVDGEQLEVESGTESPLSDVKREAVMSTGGQVGYKETAAEQYTKGVFIFTSGFPIDKLKSATNMLVTTEYANGRVYTLSGAYVEGDYSAKGDDGKVEMKFSGTKGVWS